MENNRPPYHDLIVLRGTLQEKLEAIKRQYDQVNKDYQSVVHTLHLLGYKQTAGLVSTELDSGNLNRFKGLTQAQALERLAKENGGRLRMKDAKRILVAAGLVKTPKNANNILYNVIQREEGKYKRVAPGEYELVSAA